MNSVERSLSPERVSVKKGTETSVDKNFGFAMNLSLKVIILWYLISMSAESAALRFDWSRAGFNMDLTVFIYSHTKNGFNFF